MRPRRPAAPARMPPLSACTHAHRAPPSTRRSHRQVRPGRGADYCARRSLRQFGEGFATPVTSFLDVPFKFDFQQESRMWSKMIGSAFTQGDGSND